MTETSPGASSPVHDLIRQREQLHGWLAKLGEVATGASNAVADRVRRDYEDRLRRVNEDLSQYRDEIERDLETRRSELEDADGRRAQAAEVLEEARLRHMIGELDDSEWERQQERLQSDVDGAAAEVERLREEVDRLGALSADVAADDAAPEPEETVAPPEVTEVEAVVETVAETEAAQPAEEDADVTSWLEQLSAATSEAPAEEAEEEPAEETESPANEPAGEDLPWLDQTAEQPQGWSPEQESGDGLEFLDALDKPAAENTDSLAEDDLAFLEELDRAISGSPGAPRGAQPPATPAAMPPAATGGSPAAERSGGPLLCKECGAINEPHSWYCEVCGSEL